MNNTYQDKILKKKPKKQPTDHVFSFLNLLTVEKLSHFMDRSLMLQLHDQMRSPDKRARLLAILSNC